MAMSAVDVVVDDNNDDMRLTGLFAFLRESESWPSTKSPCRIRESDSHKSCEIVGPTRIPGQPALPSGRQSS